MSWRIVVPDRLDAQHTLAFAQTLGQVPPNDEYVFDFGTLGFVEPFGMLLAASLLRQFKVRTAKPGENLPHCHAQNFGKCDYAAHMGLFQSFGLNFGNFPGAASGGPTYIPITEIDLNELRLAANQLHKDPRTLLEDKSGDMARLLTRQNGGALVDTLTYSLREMMRNVVEHSEASKIWYAGQYWPTQDRVEVAILDEGIGIYRSLSRNPRLTLQNEEDALRQSLQPKVSGIAYRGSSRLKYQSDTWRNSGYGLYIVSGICAASGNFVLASGSSALVMGRDNEGNLRERIVSTAFGGTALRLILKPSRLSDFNSALRGMIGHIEDSQWWTSPLRQASHRKRRRGLKICFPGSPVICLLLKSAVAGKRRSITPSRNRRDGRLPSR
jgi:hypothetical protein